MCLQFSNPKSHNIKLIGVAKININLNFFISLFFLFFSCGISVLNSLFLLLVALCCIPLAVSGQGTNIAYQDSQVRFTVVTDSTLRLEYAPDGQFIDDFSFVAVNRHYPAVDYKLKKDGNWIELSTSRFRMKYKKGSGQFTSRNLSITSAKGMYPFRWMPGMKQKCNLKGT